MTASSPAPKLYQELVQDAVITRNTSVSIGDHFTDFTAEKVEEERYNSASNVVRAGLQLLEKEEAKLTRLRALIDEGDASGCGEGGDFDAFLAEARSKHS